ncbi:hypothetical protein [Methanohalophilus sp.]
MQWKISVFLLVAMLCLAFTGAAAAEDVKCCWEKPCGTEVEQCDQETVFSLYDLTDAQIVTTSDGYYYLDADPNDGGAVSVDDIRLTRFHNKYPPNTQVGPTDQDNGDAFTVVNEANLTYADLNANGVYDATDGVVLDINGDSVINQGPAGSIGGDILLTDLPATDVYEVVEEVDTATGESHAVANLVMEKGELGNAWDWVTLSHDAKDTALTTLPVSVPSYKYVDADDSDHYNTGDKVYVKVSNLAAIDQTVQENAVTIGDVRLFIPDNDPCIPDCGTKVLQGDHDATYVLNGFSSERQDVASSTCNDEPYLAYYTQGELGDGIPTEVYVDMDANGVVSLGDVRLTNVSTNYPPNSKVVPSNRFDIGHELAPMGENNPVTGNNVGDADLKYVETDGQAYTGSYTYSLGDAVYINANNAQNTLEQQIVNRGDIRLVEVEVSGVTYAAWSVVEAGDEDDGTPFTGNVGGGAADEEANYDFADLAGYIDTDANGYWSCPDKLYVQQLDMLDDYPINNAVVTVGDLRLYVPFNDPISPWNGMTEAPWHTVEDDNAYEVVWPDCGTKVTMCELDAEFALSTPVFTNYGEAGEAGIKYSERDGDTGFGVMDNAYIDMDGNDVVSTGDIRLTDVSVNGEWFYYNNTKVGDQHEGDKGHALLPGNASEAIDIRLSDRDLLGVVPVGDINTVDQSETPENFSVRIFDNDCSGGWSCVDALYLDVNDDHTSDDFFVTHGDIRLFIKPDLICDEEEPQEPPVTPDYNQFDADEDGEISETELSNAITAYYDGDIGESELSEIIDFFYLGGAGYL